MSGKLTVQHFLAGKEREAERQRKIDEGVAELSREIASIIVRSRRRKPSLFQRFIRTIAIPF